MCVSTLRGLVFLIISMLSGAALADTQNDVTLAGAGSGGQEEAKSSGLPQLDVGYGSKGLKVATRDGKYEVNFGLRAQLRLFYPFDSDPRSEADFDEDEELKFQLSRIRLKLAGHAYRSWLKYDLQYDFLDTRLLDLRFAFAKWAWLQFHTGQYKAEYSRERLDSSSKLQLVDRSIVNREFTIDRQQGGTVFGRMMPGTHADSRYWIGVFTGLGRGETDVDDEHPMVLGRWQWNFLGQDMDFSQSDVEYHDKPAASFAGAAAYNRSRFTRFSSDGGGQLDGFAPGSPGQYEIPQATQDFIFKYRGLSVQQEFHWKRIEDNDTDSDTELTGLFAQAGYFFHGLVPWIPRPLETAFRYAFVNPDTSRDNDWREEFTGGLNWYFAKHNNKLSADVSYLTLEQDAGSDEDDVRFRLQWEVSF
jgi:hypothetical protein